MKSLRNHHVAALTALPLAASLILAATAAPSAATSNTQAPSVDKTVQATGSGKYARLPRWTPTPGDTVLVSVATQGASNIDVRISAARLNFEKVAETTSSQGVVRLTTFAAKAVKDAGQITVLLPGNRGPASVVGMSVTGAKQQNDGGKPLMTVLTTTGPTVDDNDLQLTVPTQPGQLAIGLGANNRRVLKNTAGQQAYATNVAKGAGANRVAISALGSVAKGATTTVGGENNLTGGTDDWALQTLIFTPKNGGANPSPTTSATMSPTSTATSPSSTTTSPTSSTTTTTSRPSSTTTRPSSTTTTKTATKTTAPGIKVPGVNARPYAANSPWNTPIGANATIHPNSARWINRLKSGPPLSSDPEQYSFPIYEADANTPRVNIKLSGWYSRYPTDNKRLSDGRAPTAWSVPVPVDAKPSPGTDGWIVIIDKETGDEYGFWQFRRDNAGNIKATNGYRYNTKLQGRFGDGLAGRGAGTTYLAGAVHDWEIDQGRIDHALAFGYRWPSREHVYPASKSDGLGDRYSDLPEGARLQLNPALTEADFNRWGLSPAGKTMAKALQEYGMYVVDNCGTSKVYVEDDLTANWQGVLERNTLSAIPWKEFRVVK